MPVYQYRQPDGRVIERVVSVNRRDMFPGRVTVPASVSLAGLKVDPTTAEPAALRGLRETELAIGSEKLCREIGYPADEVKRIWSEP